MLRIFTYIALLYFSASACLSAQTISIYFGDTVYVDPSQDFWIDMRVNGFNQIPAFSFALQYDSTNLQFLGSAQPTLADSIILNADPGLIKIAWVSGSGIGLTLIDSSILLRLHFKAKQQYPITTTLGQSTVLNTEFYQFDGVNLTLLPSVIIGQIIMIRVCSVMIDLGDDKAFCSGDSIQLVANCQNCNQIEWSNGSQSASVIFFAPGLYSATASAPFACYARDSVEVTEIKLPELYLPDSLNICSGETVILSPLVSSNATIQWSNGASLPAIEVNTADLYIATVSNLFGCSKADSVQIIAKPLPNVQLPVDTVLCEGQQLVVNITPEPNTTYFWNTGVTDPIPTFSQSGAIVLIGVMDGCTASDTMQLMFRPLPVVNLGNDTQYCNGEIVPIGVPTQTGAVYEWDTGDSSPVIYLSDTATKTLRITKEGCSVSDTITVTFQDCQLSKFFVPNAFTPESQSDNANFGAFFSVDANIESFEISIFDRWGSLVFQSTNPSEYWDGSINNRSAPVGVYIYQVRVKYETDGVEFREGDVTLFR